MSESAEDEAQGAPSRSRSPGWAIAALGAAATLLAAVIAAIVAYQVALLQAGSESERSLEESTRQQRQALYSAFFDAEQKLEGSEHSYFIALSDVTATVAPADGLETRDEELYNDLAKLETSLSSMKIFASEDAYDVASDLYLTHRKLVLRLHQLYEDGKEYSDARDDAYYNNERDAITVIATETGDLAHRFQEQASSELIGTGQK
jgi:hypothetical protein